MIRTEPTLGKVLFVDDEDMNRRVIGRLLQADGYEVAVAPNGREALEAVAAECPDIILMDVMMPVMDGLEACRRLKNDPATRLIPIIMVTALDEKEDRLRAIEAGADDFLAKPVDHFELQARVRSLLRIKRYTDELESAEAVIMSLALTIEARDAYTEGHCERLSGYATLLGAGLSLDEADLMTLRRAAFLHDLGKIVVPDGILMKRGRLTEAEYEVIKQHPPVGERLCGKLRSLRGVLPAIRHHHERLDGTGYPDGLSGSDVPLLAQIIGVVDIYDALTTVRPYKTALPPEQAYEVLTSEVQKGWRRKDLVDALVTLGRAGELDRVAHESQASKPSSP